MMGCTYETLKRVMIDLNIRVCCGLKSIGHFEAGEVLKDEKLMDEAKSAGEKLVDAINLKKDNNHN